MISSAPVVKREEFEEQEEAGKGPFRIKAPEGERWQCDRKTKDWKNQQNIQYAAFLKRFKVAMEDKPMGKLWKHFEMMAKFVKTRNTCQCKSHHQQLYNRFSSFSAILAHLEAQIPHFTSKLALSQEQLALFISELGQPTNPAPPSQEAKKPEVLAPTNDQYDEGAGQERVQKEKLNIFDAFPMRTLSSLPEGYSSLFQKYPHYDGQKSKDSEWAECHYYFMQWMSRLKELVLPLN